MKIDLKRKKGQGNPVLKTHIDPKTGAVIPLFHFPLLEETGLVEHCFTTRMGGVSEGIFGTMNLSFSRGDDPEAVFENYERIARILYTAPENIVTSDQTHTTNVRKVGKEDCGKGMVRHRDYTDIDGLITDEPGVVLSTFYADCVPLYFVDPVRRAIGLSHSGWKGTVNRMGKKTLKAMKETYGTEAKDVFCAIGPSICKDCYEISEDVAVYFAAEFTESEHFLFPRGKGKYLLDLWKVNERILLEAGVQKEHIAVTDVCTCCNPELLFSHRASNGKRGNLGAFMYLKE